MNFIHRTQPKFSLCLVWLLCLVFTLPCVSQQVASVTAGDNQTIYSFEVKDINGQNFSFGTLRGKKIMVVNTASKCGLTPQYEDLQKLYEKYGGETFTIVAFPANNFMKQEPGEDNEIAAFCKETYNIKFPIMSKISVKGDDMHEIYGFLTSMEKNGIMDSEVKWNFQKYLIDEAGHLSKVISPKTNPFDSEIVDWIER